LEPLEPADELDGEAAHLGEVAGDRDDFRAHALLERGTQPFRHGRLELGRRLREPLQRGLGALEGRLEVGPGGAFLPSFGEPAPGPFERVAIHRR
jgi:hypothetical protein